MDNKVSLNDMIRQIREWHTEALNMRNDGWTQQAFKDRLNHLHALTTRVVESVDPERNKESEEDS